jgi:hypothetical protein
MCVVPDHFVTANKMVGLFVGRAGERLLGAEQGRGLLGETPETCMAFELNQDFFKLSTIFSRKGEFRSVNEMKVKCAVVFFDAGDRGQVESGVANYDESKQGKRREFIL